MMNQEILNNMISLQNQINILKEENKNQKKIIEDLKTKTITKELLETLYPKNLKFNNINFDELGAILTNEKSVQYGPYKKYEEGKYCIIYYGNNLTKLLFDCCDNLGKNLIKINMLYQLSNKAAYDVFLTENNQCIEFRAKGKILNKKEFLKQNRGKKNIKKLLEERCKVNSRIEKVEVYRYKNC